LGSLVIGAKNYYGPPIKTNSTEVRNRTRAAMHVKYLALAHGIGQA